MNGLSVGAGTQITLHFSLSLEDGSVVDSNFDSAPATFVFGDGKILPGFEKALIGLTRGEKRSFNIPPEDGFGQPNPNNLHEIERAAFSEDLELAVGLVISFVDAAEKERPGVIAGITEEVVTVDFNHPLAGKVIVFRVEIIDVTPVVTH